MIRKFIKSILSPRQTIVELTRKKMPPLSSTEREALESGTVGWEGELISGTPDWKKLFALNKPQLTSEEQAFVDGPTEELCKMLDKWDIQKQGDLPKEAWDFLKKERFFGIEVPKEYGGLGFSSQAHSAIVMKVASRSITGAVTVMVPNSLGPAELIHEYGTKAQKDYYLPRLASGQEIPCFALTGPEAGSDAGSLPDTGIVCKNAKGEIGIRLNWEKRYITLGPIATLIGLAVKLEDPDNLLGKNQKDLGITVVLVKNDTPGVEIGDRHRPMDLPFQNGPNKGKDVFVPLDNIIGGAERAGQGWKMLMEALAVGRSLSLPALSVAGAQLSSYSTGAYSRVRRQFGMPIAKFEGVEEILGRMAGTTYLMNAARAATLQMVDQGERPAIPSAFVKYHLTEGMRKVVNDAVDIHGGKAVMNGPENYLADLYKGIPIAITVEGSNPMTRNLIIFGQGSVRTHPYFLKITQAVNDPDYKKAFSGLIRNGAGLTYSIVKHAVKTAVYNVTGGRFSRVPKDVDKTTKKYYRQINRLCAAFNLTASATVATVGGDLKRKERNSARLGDVFSNLYLASTVLWYYEKNGRQKEDLPLVQWACTQALHDAEKALHQELKNPPNLIVRMLKPLVFPFGKRSEIPNDKMDAKAADVIRNPGPAFERLSANIFKPTNENEPLGKLAIAFKISVETEGLEKKLSLAARAGTMENSNTREGQLVNAIKAGVITEDELRTLRLADKARRDVIMVDSFPQNYVEEEKKPAPAQSPKI